MMATHLAESSSAVPAPAHTARSELVRQARSTMQVAQRCDALCLSVGALLGDAIPVLNTLSARFNALSETIETGDMYTAACGLDRVAQDVRAIGTGLMHESRALADLIKLNLVLSLRIANVADDVRFLVAMVSNAKVELASIEDQGEGLDSFGRTLEVLAAKADRTLREYGTTHGTLLTHLRKTAKVHRAFEESHRDRLAEVANDIDFSVSTILAGRTTIASAAALIGTTSQKIGMQIADCVMALQIGDTTRQRIEHVNEALLIASEKLDDGHFESETSALEGMGAASRLCRLQEIQLADAAVEFKAEIATIESLLSAIVASVDGLINRTNPLVTTKGRPAVSFRDDLEPKLKAAEQLIGQFKESRVIVDGIAVLVVTTFETLEQLASSVASMATDMTIIGTNAIVKSFRLGQRGAGLSIIAQHLRGHALKVAEGIKLLTPAMADARNAAKGFISALEGQDAARIAALASRMGEVVQSFTIVGSQMTEAMQLLEHDTTGVGSVLRQAVESLDIVTACDDRLTEAGQSIGDLADDFDAKGASIDAEADAALDRLLKPRYTMASERTVHDAFFAPHGARHHPVAVATNDEDINALLF